MSCDVKSSFKTGLQISLSLSPEIYHIDSPISFDKNWILRFKIGDHFFFLNFKLRAVFTEARSQLEAWSQPTAQS
jgi:hypothetical protein